MSRVTLLKALALLVLVAGGTVLAVAVGTPDVVDVKTRIHEAGLWGPVLFFAAYTLLALIPWPKAVLTAAGGAVFGLWAGAALSLAAALAGAIVSFGIGRLLGREAVDRLTRGRLARVDALLRDHGLPAVLVVRLIPLVPFTAVNYAAGLSGVRFRDYLVGTPALAVREQAEARGQANLQRTRPEAEWRR